MENEKSNRKQTRGGGLENKAFTLIELLGVIIIIGIIALIAVPIIMNIIGKVRKSAFERSVEGIIKSVELNHAMDFVVPRKYFYEKGTLTLLSVEGNVRNEKIGANGKIEGNGWIRVDEKRVIYVENLCDKNYCANGERRKLKISPNRDGEIPEINKEFPVITVNPERVTLEVSEVAEYNVLSGVSATDETDGEIESSKIIITSDLSATPGTYTITYQVTNSIGNTSTATRTVIVEKKGLPDAGDEGKIVTDLEGNQRYSGSNPNNWVCFGKSDIKNPEECDTNHKWRIIGIFDGKMKIMTNYYYSEEKAWDIYNKNSWENASLKTELNGNGFYNNDMYIDGSHRGYIINATWYTGGRMGTNRTFQSFVDGERSNSATGYVGLMSVVDFGYAGNDCTLTTDMFSRLNACMSNNWIGYSKNQWTIAVEKGTLNGVFNVIKDDKFRSSGSTSLLGVRPSVCLDSSVKLTGGDGTESNPYILAK